MPRARLEPWSESDRSLLDRLNTADMTAHLGGPEPPDRVEERHRRYLAAAGSDSVFVYRVVAEPEGATVGQVAFWERDWRDEPVYEMGWGIVPEHQGRGLASAAAHAAAEVARGLGQRRWMHAFPGVDNGPSNAICRRLGFELLGEVDFEYPEGSWMRCHDWRLPLAPARPEPIH